MAPAATAATTDIAAAAGQRVAVVGAGWAGLAAAVRATQAGHHVTLFDSAAVPGGRARSLHTTSSTNSTNSTTGTTDDQASSVPLDNGQHILIGAYQRCLDLMRTVGADPAQQLHRMPLVLRHADGRGLSLPAGHPLLAFTRAVLGADGWSWNDRAALLAAAGGWLLRGFRCPADWTVARLCQGLPANVRTLLIDPLCVAALNTPASGASAAVFLKVLNDALFAGPGSADLLLPRQPLGALLPEPALRWLQAQGAHGRWRNRVLDLRPQAGGGWWVDAQAFDAVVLACSASEAARLAQATAPAWAAAAAALRYEPIVTVYLQAPCPPAPAWPAPMLALQEGADAPAQYAFDLGALGGPAGRYSFVVSGAAAWVDKGLDATGEAVLAQAASLLPGASLLRTLAEKRATFRCTPDLQRPAASVAPGLWAAGDYVAGPYPATLEGAVRSGEAAAAQISSGSGAFRDAKLAAPH